MTNDNNLEQRLAKLKGIGAKDTVKNLLTSFRDASIAAGKATTPEAIANSIYQLQESTTKLVHKSLGMSHTQEKIDLLQEIKNAPSIIKKLNERKDDLELKERMKKLSGLPEKSTPHALQDLKDAKNEVRSAKTAEALKHSLDHLKMAIRVVLGKMQESSKKEKQNLYEEIYRANEFFKMYSNKTLPTAKSAQESITTVATSHRSVTTEEGKTKTASSKTQFQAPPEPKSKTQNMQARFFKSPIIKEPTQVQEGMQQKYSQMNPLYKQLAQAKIEADKAKAKATEAVKKYKNHKTSYTHNEALASLKQAKAKKHSVDFLQEQIKKLESVYGKATQFKNTLHNFKQKQKPSIQDKPDSSNNRFRP